jgi:hypothetical protein
MTDYHVNNQLGAAYGSLATIAGILLGFFDHVTIEDAGRTTTLAIIGGLVGWLTTNFLNRFALWLKHQKKK